MGPNTYRPIQQIRDVQPIRATCFHPSGEVYVVGTNSKALKICRYPSLDRQRELLDCDGLLMEPEISFACLHIHCASVYCASFNPKGNLLATGSNDQIVHLIKYNSTRHGPEGSEHKLSMHNGTVRDVCFLHGEAEARLLSAGAGDFAIHLTDCNTMKPVQVFKGHESTIMSLTSCDGSPDLFVSGSLDGTIRLWDVRIKATIAMVTAGGRQKQTHRQPILTTDGDTSFDFSHKNGDSLHGGQPEATIDDKHHNGALNSDQQQDVLESKSTGVGAVRLDPTGRLLVSGHQDGSCMLYDVRAGRAIQIFHAHDAEIRSLGFSPNSYYLLTGSYDGRVKLTDLQGQLTLPLPGIDIADLEDKVIQVAWHPTDYNFVSTCADGSATLWTIPDFDEWRDSIVMETSVMV